MASGLTESQKEKIQRLVKEQDTYYVNVVEIIRKLEQEEKVSSRDVVEYVNELKKNIKKKEESVDKDKQLRRINDFIKAEPSMTLGALMEELKKEFGKTISKEDVREYVSRINEQNRELQTRQVKWFTENIKLLESKEGKKLTYGKIVDILTHRFGAFLIPKALIEKYASTSAEDYEKQVQEKEQKAIEEQKIKNEKARLFEKKRGKVKTTRRDRYEKDIVVGVKRRGQRKVEEKEEEEVKEILQPIKGKKKDEKKQVQRAIQIKKAVGPKILNNIPGSLWDTIKFSEKNATLLRRNEDGEIEEVKIEEPKDDIYGVIRLVEDDFFEVLGQNGRIYRLDRDDESIEFGVTKFLEGGMRRIIVGIDDFGDPIDEDIEAADDVMYGEEIEELRFKKREAERKRKRIFRYEPTEVFEFKDERKFERRGHIIDLNLQNIKEKKLVVRQIQKKVYADIDFIHSMKEEVKMDPLGRWIPTREKGKTSLVGERFTLILPVPEKEERKELPGIVKTHPLFKLSQIITFSSHEFKLREDGLYENQVLKKSKKPLRTFEGKIVDFQGNDLIVKLEGWKLPTTMVVVSPKQDVVIVKKLQDLSISPVEFLGSSRIISPVIRMMIRQLYTDRLKSLGQRDDELALESMIPQGKFKTWEEYYREQFDQWFWAKMYPQLASSVIITEKDQEDLVRKAEIERSPIVVIQDLEDSNPGFFQMTDVQMIRYLREKENKSPLEVSLMIDLERWNAARNEEEISGKDLIIDLANAVSSFLSRLPFSIEVESERLRLERIRELYSKIAPSKEEEKEFRDRHRAELSQLYDIYKKEYDNVTEKNKGIVENNEKVKTKVLFNVENDVREFENLVYQMNSDNLKRYLEVCMKPYTFLNKESLGNYAKVFQAKLRSRQFILSRCSEFNYAHFIPELFMNKEVLQKKSKEVLNALHRILMRDIYQAITNYLKLLNSFRKVEELESIEEDIAFVASFIVIPQEVCSSDTGSGKGVSDEDIIICMTDGKFTCHNIEDVKNDIVEGNNNPFTKKPYPADFIRRFKEKYSFVSYEDMFGKDLPKIEKKESALVRFGKTPRGIEILKKYGIEQKNLESVLSGEGLIENDEPIFLYRSEMWNALDKCIRNCKRARINEDHGGSLLVIGFVEQEVVEQLNNRFRFLRIEVLEKPLNKKTEGPYDLDRFANYSFDVVFCGFDFLSVELKNKIELSTQLHRILVPGGALIALEHDGSQKSSDEIYLEQKLYSIKYQGKYYDYPVKYASYEEIKKFPKFDLCEAHRMTARPGTYQSAGYLLMMIRKPEKFPGWVLNENKDYELFSIVEESAYSSLMPYQIEQVNKVLKKIKNVDSILDGSAHIGADTINFAKNFPDAKIYAYEIKRSTYLALRGNVEAFVEKELKKLSEVKLRSLCTEWMPGREFSSIEELKTCYRMNRITCLNKNILSATIDSYKPRVSLVYFDPPWGGKDYIGQETMDLFLGGRRISNVVEEFLTELIAQQALVKVPRNFDMSGIVELKRNYEVFDIRSKKDVAYRLILVGDRTVKEKKKEVEKEDEAENERLEEEERERQRKLEKARAKREQREMEAGDIDEEEGDED